MMKNLRWRVGLTVVVIAPPLVSTNAAFHPDSDAGVISPSLEVRLPPMFRNPFMSYAVVPERPFLIDT